MKTRFNWIDACIVLVVIGICFAGYKILNKENTKITEKTEPIEVTVRIEDIRKESDDVIKVGTVYKNKDTNQVFGTVIGKKVEDYDKGVRTGDGRIVKTKVPGKYRAFITLKGDANVTDDYIQLGGKDVRIEGSIDLKSNISAVQVKVVDIKLAE